MEDFYFYLAELYFSGYSNALWHLSRVPRAVITGTIFCFLFLCCLSLESGICFITSIPVTSITFEMQFNRLMYIFHAAIGDLCFLFIFDTFRNFNGPPISSFLLFLVIANLIWFLDLYLPSRLFKRFEQEICQLFLRTISSILRVRNIPAFGQCIIAVQHFVSIWNFMVHWIKMFLFTPYRHGLL